MSKSDPRKYLLVSHFYTTKMNQPVARVSEIKSMKMLKKLFCNLNKK
jgi:hypothetical protein